MTKHFRFPAIQLGEQEWVATAEISPKVQILRAGTFNHPEYGTFEIKKEHIESMVRNFESKVRKIDLAIDFAHESDKIAAGWVESLFLDESSGVAELWATVKWTPPGKQSLIDRQYRYLSADFTFNYQDNETLQEYGPTLFGAGLTNRPVVKAMAPVIELSERKEINKMDEKDKMIEQLKAQIAELLKAKEGYETEMGAMKAKMGDYETQMGAAKMEKEAVEKALAEKVKGDKFNALMSEGKTCEAQRDAFMKDDFENFAKLAQPVKLNETGNKTGECQKTTPSTSDEAYEEIMKLAAARVSENKSLILADAVSQVLEENRDLAKTYYGNKGE